MFRNSLKMLLTGGKANRKSRSSDGGSEDLADPRSPSLDPHLSHVGQGGSIDSDCAFEGDYAVPPLSMTEGMQHIRIMEGVSRSLPSSPLLTHQTISVRLQPVKKLTGKDTAVKSHSHRGTDLGLGRKLQPTEMWAECGGNLSCTHIPACSCPPP